MATPPRNSRQGDGSGDLDWRWGFEPEAWISLRSRKALAGKPLPPSITAEPTAPLRRHLLPRLAAMMRSLFAG